MLIHKKNYNNKNYKIKNILYKCKIKIKKKLFILYNIHNYKHIIFRHFNPG